MRGRVIEFDERRGLGSIVGADGRTYPFHCISIADGSRTIDEGAEVEFDPLPRLGRDEAAAIRPV